MKANDSWGDLCQVLLHTPISPKKDLTLRFKVIFSYKKIHLSRKSNFPVRKLPSVGPESNIYHFRIEVLKCFYNSLEAKLYLHRCVFLYPTWCEYSYISLRKEWRVRVYCALPYPRGCYVVLYYYCSNIQRKLNSQTLLAQRVFAPII